MYFARDNTNGDILNGKNIISIPGQYVGRADRQGAQAESFRQG